MISNQTAKKLLNIASSKEVAIVLIALTSLLSVAGALVPQNGSREELFENFGTTGVSLLDFFGLTNVFQSPVFLLIIGLLFLNLLFCTVTRMLPRSVRRIKGEDFLGHDQILKFSQSRSMRLSLPFETAMIELEREMRRLGYECRVSGTKAVFRKGKLGWFAAPVTHLGLFVLLAGVTVSAVFSYAGYMTLMEGETKGLRQSLTRPPLAGAPDDALIDLVSTRREVYETGAPRQFFSALQATDNKGKKGRGNISVNHPWTFRNVDFYQSDWSAAGVRLVLNGRAVDIPLSDMAHSKMGVIMLFTDVMMIAVLDDKKQSIRLFLKEMQTGSPRFFATLILGEETKGLPLSVRFDRINARSGISFKYDPGLPITYLAFAILMCGSVLVASPSISLFASGQALAFEETALIIGFQGLKAAGAARRDLLKLEASLASFSAESSEQNTAMPLECS